MSEQSAHTADDADQPAHHSHLHRHADGVIHQHAHGHGDHDHRHEHEAAPPNQAPAGEKHAERDER